MQWPSEWTRTALLWLLVALAGLLGAGAGFLLLNGLLGLTDPSMQLWGWAPGIPLALGTVCLLGLAGLLTFMATGWRRRRASWALRE